MEIPAFFEALMGARSPSGYEYEAQRVIDAHMEPVADTLQGDALGNRIARLNLKGDPVLMLAGHMDELGLIIRYINKEGFLYFDTLGGHDLGIIPGRRVQILSSKGAIVQGVTGKRAVHLMDAEERKKAPELHKLWIDIGVKSQTEALERVSIGDPIVYADGLAPLFGSRVVGRAIDNRAGAYVVCEVLRRLSTEAQGLLKAQVVAVATTQEEVGTRGAAVSVYGVQPHIAVAVDVTHATDHPECDRCKFGDVKLGAGPVLTRGPNINPFVYQRLLDCCRQAEIPYQIEADGRPTGTDARVLQVSRSGVATGLVSIPLRYMHTPAETIDLEDLENTVRLLKAFALSLIPGEYGHF